jgi:hypothetical protein
MWNFLHSTDQLILLILAHNWDPWLMWNFLHSTDQLILLVLAHNWDPWLMWNFLHLTGHLIFLVLAHNWDPRVVRSTSWQVDDWLLILDQGLALHVTGDNLWLVNQVNPLPALVVGLHCVYYMIVGRLIWSVFSGLTFAWFKNLKLNWMWGHASRHWWCTHAEF